MGELQLMETDIGAWEVERCYDNRLGKSQVALRNFFHFSEFKSRLLYDRERDRGYEWA